MSASSRTYFVGGNWKCNGTKASVETLCKDLSKIDTKGVDVIVAPISLHLLTVQNALKNMKVSAQNVSATKQGAYTGLCVCVCVCVCILNLCFLFFYCHNAYCVEIGTTSDLQMHKNKAFFVFFCKE